MSRVASLAALLIGSAVGQHEPGGYVYSQHKLQHPYTETGLEIPHWNYGGDTVITDQVIRLTPDRQSKRGTLWNTVPWSPPRDDKKGYFELIFEFHVHGQGTKLYGDGLALWYTRRIHQPGPVFGSADHFDGLGIMFDTYSNVQQGHSQYISVIFGDGKTGYEHDKDGGDAKLAGCAVDFRGQKMDVKLIYDKELLRMYTGKPNEGWEECFIVRRVKLDPGGFFGLSAATGDLADNHDVVSFKVSDPTEMSEEETRDLAQRIEMDVDRGVENEVHHDPQYENQQQEVGKPLPLWISLSAIGLVVVVIAGLVYMSQRSQTHHAKHFT